MRLKVFQAPNIGAAMTMVREELGPDALILANRAVEGGVELTAAQEHPATPPPPLALPPAAPVFPRPTEIVRAIPGEIARGGTLRWHGVPDELAARLGRGDLSTLIASQFRFAPLPCGHDEAPLLLVGPPGAGKTLTVARLATRLKLAGQASLVITADGRRAGAAEQLAAFTRLLGLTLVVADTPAQLTRALARRVDGQPVLVDMPGLDPFHPPDRDLLRECQAATGGGVALVLPAGIDPADAHDLGDGFRELGARYLIATRLDQSRRLGGVLAAAATGLWCTEAGVNAAVANGLVPMTPELLAARLSCARAPSMDEASPPASRASLARPRQNPPSPSP